jgi:type I restriction enzyme M protein
MALKKSELYSSLWQSCDQLRGGMDASQYKDYVLSLLFIKYISDKYDGQPYSPIKIPKGASFQAMVALKGKSDIGDRINKKIIAPLAAANQQLSQSDFPDFNDATKLGDGKEKVDRLTNLVAIFESKTLDFSKNRAEGDDILGDAYEYLMRHFASESGKSKGQFYTPAEVSRIMAQILGIRRARTSSNTTVYDPTCGSGSLLLKVGDEAGTAVTLYGQEKDATTSGLARMNMILHNNPTATIVQGNTLSSPKFLEGDTLKTFHYVVANPPFSDKRWTTGLNPAKDPHERFKPFGVPPAKQGDYAYLLHIVRSLRSTGTGACILPHGVLFRGNAEADIRRALVRKGYIKAIIGLPANLFYGTGIPACIVVVAKKDAAARRGIFMIDASDGFMKDGPKNRLRSQDIHKIVDVFGRQEGVAGYSKIVSLAEIENSEFNLNLPRYIDSRQAEDIQDIGGHLQGGIPVADIDSLSRYWDVCPALRKALFKRNRKGYVDLRVDKADIQSAIYQHAEFVAFVDEMNGHFDKWRGRVARELRKLKAGVKPKQVIVELSEGLLAHYTGRALIDRYDVYQHLMDYWGEVMQDDVYQIAVEGWKAETYRILVKDKKGKEKDKGWACDLVPKALIVARYFADEQAAIDDLKAEHETASSSLTQLDEEHSGEEGALRAVSNKTDAQKAWGEAVLAAWEELMPGSYAEYQGAVVLRDRESARLAKMFEDRRLQALKNEKGNITKTDVNKRVKQLKASKEKTFLTDYLTALDSYKEAASKARDLHASAESELTVRLVDNPDDESLVELRVLREYLQLTQQIADLDKRRKDAEAELDAQAYAKYPELSEKEVKTLVVDDKWLAVLDVTVHGEMDRISQSLAQRLKELAERYGTALPQLSDCLVDLEEKVNGHLQQMGFHVLESRLTEAGT